ncbi:MAG: DUF3108 domain-containing protein [Candidatus Omnitrophica bacterium]|nr:DUF3108 domain-containing protein [Candidatus Omnitrophota bacterium]
MTRYRFIAVCLACLLAIPALTRPCSAAVRYSPGEVIHYNIKQLGVKAGEASLTFVGETQLDGTKVVLIRFASRGPAFFDNEDIYLDPQTFRPVRVQRDLKIFGGHERIEEDYRTEGQVRIRKDADGKVTETVLSTKGPVDNIYGFIYRYRAEGDFSVQKSFAIRLPTVELTMKVIDDGSFKAVGQVFRAAIIRSVPAKYTIWMDKGEKRLPLRIAGAVGLGNTVMTMTGYGNEGVRSDVRSNTAEGQ